MPGTIKIQHLEMLLRFLVCSQPQYSSSMDTSKVLEMLFFLPWVSSKPTQHRQRPQPPGTPVGMFGQLVQEGGYKILIISISSQPALSCSPRDARRFPSNSMQSAKKKRELFIRELLAMEEERRAEEGGSAGRSCSAQHLCEGCRLCCSWAKNNH